MSECAGRRCGAVLEDGIFLCDQHTRDLGDDLRAVPSLWVDLRTTIGRQDATAASVGGGEGGSRPCMNVDAWDKRETLLSVLRGWGQALNPNYRATMPDRGDGWSLYLTIHLEQVRKHEWAGDLAYELRASINECQHATDRAADRITLGECGNRIGDVVCLGTVRSTVGASLGRCGECRAVYDVRERQQWMISEAWHVTGFLPDVVRWLDRAGHAKLNVQKVKNWVHKGRLESCGVAEGRPVYTPAAVMAAYRETPTGRIPTDKREFVAC